MGKTPLVTSPGNRFFKFGSDVGMEGYCDNIMEQKDDYIDCMKVLYPLYTHQIAVEVHWSSGHLKYDDDEHRMHEHWMGRQATDNAASKLCEGDIDTINPIYHPGNMQEMVIKDVGPH